MAKRGRGKGKGERDAGQPRSSRGKRPPTELDKLRARVDELQKQIRGERPDDTDYSVENKADMPLNALRSGEWIAEGNAKYVLAKVVDAFNGPGFNELDLVSRVQIKGDTYYPPADIVRGGYSRLISWFAYRNITLDDIDVEDLHWTVEGYSGTQSPGNARK
jgi:hypothetical protein